MDLISLMGQLSLHIQQQDVVLFDKIIKLLLYYWRDSDSEIRRTSIQLLKWLGESGAEFSTSTHKFIMQEIASLMMNTEFPDKSLLQQFLQFRVLQQVQK
jgi:hypothetical protein